MIFSKRKLINNVTFISLGITSFKLFDIIYLFDVLVPIFLLLINNKPRKDVRLLNLFKNYFILLIVLVAIISLCYVIFHSSFFLFELFKSIIRLLVLTFFTFKVINMSVNKGEEVLSLIRTSFLFHFFMLVCTFIFHRFRIFNNILKINSWKSATELESGYLKVFEYPSFADRYSGLFEEPSHFNFLIILFLIHIIYVSIYRSKPIRNIDFILIFISIALTKSVGGFIIISLLTLYYFYKFNAKVFYRFSFLFFVGIISLINRFSEIIYIIPRIGSIISGEDKSLNVRLFGILDPINKLLESPFYIFGQGFGMSSIITEGYVSQIIPLTIFLETGFFGLFLYLYYLLYNISRNFFIHFIVFIFCFTNGFFINPYILLILLSLTLFKLKRINLIENINL